MSDAIIIDVGTALARLGLEDQTAISSAVEGAITTAHVFFESRLRSQIDKRAAYTSFFYLDSGMMPVRPGKVFRLCLPHMFLIPNTVTLASADTRLRVHTDAEAVPAEDFQVDTLRGLVFIDESYADLFVKVDYEAGFDSTNKPPTWLQEAALFYIPTVLNLTQPTNRNDEYLKIAKDIQQTAGAMVEPYMRETALQLNPMY